MSVESALCRWAEQKYGLASVVDVQFELCDDGDYSELTPGEGPYVEVRVTYLGRDGRQRHIRRDFVYDASLIREIVRFTTG